MQPLPPRKLKDRRRVCPVANAGGGPNRKRQKRRRVKDGGGARRRLSPGRGTKDLPWIVTGFLYKRKTAGRK